MNRNTWFAVALLVTCAAGCSRADRDTAIAATLASLPVGGVVGPQPGPNRSVARAPNPYADDPSARRDGKRLFDWYNCSGCHGSHAGGGMGPSLRDSAWLYGNRPDDIYNSIAEGRGNGMPSWGSKIPSEQIWQLVSYVESLGTNKEVEPPPPLPPEPKPLPQAGPQ